MEDNQKIVYRLATGQKLKMLSDEVEMIAGDIINEKVRVITFLREPKVGYIKKGTKPTGRPKGSKNKIKKESIEKTNDIITFKTSNGKICSIIDGIFVMDDI